METGRPQGAEDWLNIQFNYWASPNSTDASLFTWLNGYSLMNVQEAIILPCRAYWTPIALKAMGQPTEIWQRAATESLYALSAQTNVLKAQLFVKEDLCRRKKI